jgi:hypothetical protein
MMWSHDQRHVMTTEMACLGTFDPEVHLRLTGHGQAE